MRTKPIYTGKKRRIRPLHRRIALHASSLLLLLGGGFIPSPFNFAAQTYSYDVTARVPAPLPGSPATITSPFDQQHVTDQTITVTGSCPDNSYVKIFVNGTEAGVANCSGGTFSVPVTLAPGANTLQAKVYNITDDEGPTSGPITVFYDAPSPPPQNPSSPPTDISVTTVDGKTVKVGDRFLLLSTQLPTFTGLAPPLSKIFITIHSNVVTCDTVANKYGWWSCTITEPLEVGDHTVHVVAITPDGRVLVYPDFSIRVYASLPQKNVPNLTPPTITIPYRFAIHSPGAEWQWSVTIGGQAPFTVTIDWGDGNTQRITRADGSPFTITHAYSKAGTYQPVVRVTDKNGLSASYQLLAEVRDKANLAAQFGGNLFSGLDPWVAWPLYAAILVGIGIFWGYELYALHRHIKRQRHARAHS